MSKDLHNMDEFFNSAYRNFSEDPSSGVWDKISAGLDKKDASSYKRKLKTWKRVAVLSLFLFGSFVIYETVLKNNLPHSNKNIPVAISTNKNAGTPKQQDKNMNSVQSLQESMTGVSTGGTTGQPDPVDAFKGQLNVSNIGQHQLDAVPKSFPDAAMVSQSLGNDEYSLINSATSSTDVASEKNSSDVAAFMETDHHVQPTYLNIVPKSPPKNETSRSNHLFYNDWTLSAYVSSDRPGYHLDKDGPALAKIKEHEEHQPSYSAGILIARHIKGRLAIQTGLIYSNTTIAISPEQIYASPNQTGKVLYKYVVSSGYAYVKPGFVAAASPGDSLTADVGEHVLQYLALPVMLKYDLIRNNRWILSPDLGIAGNFLARANVETDLEQSSNREHVSIRKLDGIRTFNWSLRGALTLEYIVGRRMSINVRPFFTYAISPITNKNDVETFPYNLGIGAGASYRF